MKLTAVTALVLSSVSGAAALTMGPQTLGSAPLPYHQEFDVAMNATSFFFEGPTNEAGAPANGTPFVVSGYLYPGDTFENYGELSGVNEDGSPEFPDLVLGTWICRGWHLQDGDAPTGPVVATTQIFEFESEVSGLHTVITDGIELADFGVPFTRAITGASGRLASVDDPYTRTEQTYVGGDVNITGGFNSEVVFAR
jgi:hypothetical protein